MRISVNNIDKFEEHPFKTSMRNSLNSGFWEECYYYHGESLWSKSWSIIKGSIGNTRSKVTKSLHSKISNFGTYSVNYIIGRHVDELVYIKGKKYLVGTYGGPTLLSKKYNHYMDVLFWEDNILKVIKHKPTNKRSFNRKNYYRETDPILSKVRDSYYPISIKIGEKYVSKDLYFSSKIKYTFHCSAGGYHRTGWKAEVHSKTVKTDVYCSYSPVEFLEKSILDLENSYMSVCSKVEQNEVKRRIALYKHKLKVMGV